MLLGILAATFSGNMLVIKRLIKAGDKIILVDDGVLRSILLQLLTSFKIQKCYQYQPKFKGFYS